MINIPNLKVNASHEQIKSSAVISTNKYRIWFTEDYQGVFTARYCDKMFNINREYKSSSYEEVVLDVLMFANSEHPDVWETPY